MAQRRSHKRSQSESFGKKLISLLVGHLPKGAPFWVALISVFAFTVGNMLGQSGTYNVFTVMFGGQRTAVLAYDGTVSPIPLTINRDCGYPLSALWRQIRTDCREPLTAQTAADHISVEFLGRYDTGKQLGSHEGVDVRAQEGTPFVAIANARVVQAGNSSGWGNYITIEFTGPDPKTDGRTEVKLRAYYAHALSITRSVGDAVKKGDVLGYVGCTGDCSGNHVHTGLVYAEGANKAPFTPYWCFTSSEARQANLSFYDAVNEALNVEQCREHLLNPLDYAFQNYPPLHKTILASNNGYTAPVVERTRTLSFRERRLAALRAQREQPDPTPAPQADVASNEVNIDESPVEDTTPVEEHAAPEEVHQEPKQTTRQHSNNPICNDAGNDEIIGIMLTDSKGNRLTSVPFDESVQVKLVTVTSKRRACDKIPQFILSAPQSVDLNQNYYSRFTDAITLRAYDRASFILQIEGTDISTQTITVQ